MQHLVYSFRSQHKLPAETGALPLVSLSSNPLELRCSRRGCQESSATGQKRDSETAGELTLETSPSVNNICDCTAHPQVRSTSVLADSPKQCRFHVSPQAMQVPRMRSHAGSMYALPVRMSLQPACINNQVDLTHAWSEVTYVHCRSGGPSSIWLCGISTCTGVIIT